MGALDRASMLLQLLQLKIRLIFIGDIADRQMVRRPGAGRGLYTKNTPPSVPLALTGVQRMSTILTYALLAVLALTAVTLYVRQNIPLWISTIFCWAMILSQAKVVFGILMHHVRLAVFGA
jgi:hypothetical protein